MEKTVLIAGASGLVGSHLLNLLLLDKTIDKIYSLVRRSTKVKHEKLQEILFDFNLSLNYQNLPPVDYGFCCLGTTIKKAGSQDAFKRVDYSYPLQLAQALKDNNCENFHVITSLGADSKSSVFYSKVKGELEEALKNIEFESLSIYQPSLLLGERKESRIGEKIAMILMPPFEFLLQGQMKKYRSIKAIDVAKGMLVNSKEKTQKIKIIPSNEIKELAHNIDRK
ncbi:NAD-dependent epimerase/dehydratase family protein [Chitinophagales bacterium]|nr:NAD-dependent epimerase/dehydratase family protein [Chitinophagales bacterium]